MKLITEHSDCINIIKEANKTGPENHFIEGIFMQSDMKNKNGRIYPSKILNNEVLRYNTEFVNKKRAMGELGHPDLPTVNLDRVAHLIESLKIDNNNITGRSKILSTPMGEITKSFINEGVSLGVSSRGMGTLKQNKDGNIVQEDYILASIDIVADPSAPEAFVQGIMEGKDWVFENGLWKEIELENVKKSIFKASSKELQETILSQFKELFSKI